MNNLMKRVFGYLLVAASLAFATGQAHAGLMVTVQFNGGPLQTVMDNGVGDADLALGVVTAALDDGAGSSVGLTANSGAPAGFLIDTQLDANIASGVGATVVVSDDGYMTTSSPSIFSSSVGVGVIGVVGSAIGSNSGMDVDIVTRVNNDIVLSAQNLGTLVNRVGSALVVTNIAPNTFTMSHTTTFLNTSTGTRRAGFTTATSIPEPSVVALLGMGLVGFGFSRRRNRSV